MADKRLSELAAIGGSSAADGDSLELLDVSAATADKNTAITIAELARAIGANARLVEGEATMPAAPTSGVRRYARKRAGRTLPAWREPTGGVGYEAQPFLGRRNFTMLKPVGTGGVTAIGCGTLTVTGTQGGGAYSAATLLGTARRATYASAATAGSIARIYESGSGRFARSNGSTPGGFHAVFRFGFDTIPATFRWFIGFFDGAGDGPLSASAPFIYTQTNIIGVGQETADATIQLFFNDSSGTATKVNTGISTPAVGDVLDISIYAPPGNTAQVFYAVEKLSGMNVSSGVYEYTQTTDLVSASVPLSLELYCGNVTTAAAVTLALVSVYIDTEFF